LEVLQKDEAMELMDAAWAPGITYFHLDEVFG
jgi:hypothetical protein